MNEDKDKETVTKHVETCIKAGLWQSTYEVTSVDDPAIKFRYTKYHYGDGSDERRNST
jgi:hypothetical protein